jgi:hypothetical protein
MSDVEEEEAQNHAAAASNMVKNDRFLTDFLAVFLILVMHRFFHNSKKVLLFSI